MRRYVSQYEALKRIQNNIHKEMQKKFHSTRDGQVVMAREAASRAPALQMNAIVKSKGGVGFPHDMIESANSILLRSIKDNLIKEYNDLLFAESRKLDNPV